MEQRIGTVNMALGSVVGKMWNVSKILRSTWAGKMSYKALSKKKDALQTCPHGQGLLPLTRK